MAGRFAALGVGTEDLAEQCELEGAGTAYEVACQLAPRVAHDTFKKKTRMFIYLHFPFALVSRVAPFGATCARPTAHRTPRALPQRPTLVLREESTS